MTVFITYRSFQSKPDFEAFIAILEAHSITYETEDYPTNFISDKINGSFNHEYQVKLEQINFQKVDEIFKRHAEKQLDTISPDYFLFSFSIEELKEVIRKQDEWSPLDVVLAQKLLSEKGVQLSEAAIRESTQNRLEELSKPEKKQTFWIVFGYIFALLGGFLAIIIGLHLALYKKTLPNGDKVYNYSEADRKHGKRIFVIGMSTFTLYMSLKFMQEYGNL